MNNINTDFFESKKYLNSNKESILKKRIAIAEKLSNLEFSNKEECIEYVLKTTMHNSEGRDLNYQKENLSITEVEEAYKYINSPIELSKYIQYRYQFNVYPREKITSEFPIVLCIEPTSKCNLRCTMCFQSDQSFSENKDLQGNMSLELFKQIIDEAKKYNLSSIVLASRGEPMMNPDIFKMIKYAKQNGILDVKMNTNATLMNERKIRLLLESGLDNLVFSVDSPYKEEFESIRRGANFDKIVKNIKKFNEIRMSEYPNSKIRTRISMVLVDNNQNVDYAEKFWGGLVDEFAYRKVIDRLHIYSKDNIENKRPCSLLWERLYVWFDGTTSLCDEDYLNNLSPGKVSKINTIHDIWNNDIMNNIRQKHIQGLKNTLHPCNKCPGF